MKRVFFIILVISLSGHIVAQDLSYGAKIGLGTGYLKTKNLPGYFDSEVTNEKCVKKYSLGVAQK